MKKPAIVIAIASLFLIVFQASPYIGIPDEAIIAMFILAPFVVIYMVYVILKFGKPPLHTFDERFYEDFDHIRSDQ